jgi:ribosome-associated protein
MKKIKINTEFIRLDALLKLAGLCETGGHAKQLILDGQVLVDGEVCLQRGRKIRPDMCVQIGQQQLTVE